MDFPSTTPTLENETTSKNEEKIVDSNVFDDINIFVEEQLVDNNSSTKEKLEDNNGSVESESVLKPTLEEPISKILETKHTL